MKITRSNYESYFLDFLEGNLENEKVNDFLEFLDNNPDLKEELQMAGSVRLEPETINFEGKERLFKEELDLPENFNEAAIAYMEGELSESRKSNFEAYLLTHPPKKDELEWFEKTRLQPDLNIVFRKKSKLYKTDREKKILLWFTRVAAVLAAAFLIYHINTDPVQDNVTTENKVIQPENNREVINPEKETVISSEAERIITSNENLQDAGIKAEKKSRLTGISQGVIESAGDEAAKEREQSLPHMAEEMPRLYASLGEEPELKVDLIPMATANIEPSDNVDEERLLGDIIREKASLDDNVLNKVARAGLELISGISGNKFNYETNTQGQITGYHYDSRLLAFSIPADPER